MVITQDYNRDLFIYIIKKKCSLCLRLGFTPHGGDLSPPNSSRALVDNEEVVLAVLSGLGSALVNLLGRHVQKRSWGWWLLWVGDELRVRLHVVDVSNASLWVHLGWGWGRQLDGGRRWGRWWGEDGDLGSGQWLHLVNDSDGLWWGHDVHGHGTAVDLDDLGNDLGGVEFADFGWTVWRELVENGSLRVDHGVHSWGSKVRETGFEVWQIWDGLWFAHFHVGDWTRFVIASDSSHEDWSREKSCWQETKTRQCNG